MGGLTLIGYDGSRDAKHAVDRAASTLRADTALVVTAWQPGLPVEQGSPALGVVPVPTATRDADLEATARTTAREGAERARKAGLTAEALVAEAASTGEIARTLTAVADDRQADTIVVGRCGLSRLETLVLGSVSEGTVRHAHCPVLVVPLADDGPQ